MKPTLTILALFIASCAFAQVPGYQPDFNGDGNISSADLLGFLSYFGSTFDASSISSGSGNFWENDLNLAEKTPVTHVLSGADYTVPEGFTLYITQLYNVTGFVRIDGQNVFYYYSGYFNGPVLEQPLVAGSGQVISSTSTAAFNGYLAPNNDREALTLSISSEDYTVPEGKRLVISSLYSVTGFMRVNDINLHYYYSNYFNSNGLSNPYIFSSGDVLSATSTCTINGYLIDSDLETVTHNLSTDYTVPTGYRLVVNNLYNVTGFFRLNGDNLFYYYCSYFNGPTLGKPFIFEEGDVLSATSSAAFNGVLIPLD